MSVRIFVGALLLKLFQADASHMSEADEGMDGSLPIEPQASTQPVKIYKGTPWYGVGSGRKPAKIKKEKHIAFKIALLVFAVFLASILSFNPSRATKNLPGGLTQYPATLAAVSAGCQGIVEYPPIDPKQIGWVPLQNGQPVFRWLTLPPVYGNFNASAWTTPGFIPSGAIVRPSFARSIADLYRGWVYVWYARHPSAQSLSGLQAWAGSLTSGSPVVATQWPLTPANEWPSGINVVLAAWGKAEYCTSFNKQALEEFRKSAALTLAPGLGLSLKEPGPEAQIRTIDLFPRN